MNGKHQWIAHIVVAAAVLTMIRLGFWQLDAAHRKEALLARYASAGSLPPIGFPTIPLHKDKLPLFRHASGNCLQVVSYRSVAGESRDGEPGFAQIADCRTGAEGPGMAVVIGWSKDPNAGKDWRGGPVRGIIAPDSHDRMRLVADTPAPGLQPVAPPSLDSIPNNHRSYVVQWFAFAATALIIYLLALRRRRRDAAAQ